MKCNTWESRKVKAILSVYGNLWIQVLQSENIENIVTLPIFLDKLEGFG